MVGKCEEATVCVTPTAKLVIRDGTLKLCKIIIILIEGVSRQVFQVWGHKVKMC